MKDYYFGECEGKLVKVLDDCIVVESASKVLYLKFSNIITYNTSKINC